MFFLMEIGLLRLALRSQGEDARRRPGALMSSVASTPGVAGGRLSPRKRPRRGGAVEGADGPVTSRVCAAKRVVAQCCYPAT